MHASAFVKRYMMLEGDEKVLLYSYLAAPYVATGAVSHDEVPFFLACIQQVHMRV
jgi:hypothetical protein